MHSGMAPHSIPIWVSILAENTQNYLNCHLQTSLNSVTAAVAKWGFASILKVSSWIVAVMTLEVQQSHLNMTKVWNASALIWMKSATLCIAEMTQTASSPLLTMQLNHKGESMEYIEEERAFCKGNFKKKNKILKKDLKDEEMEEKEAEGKR